MTPEEYIKLRTFKAHDIGSFETVIKAKDAFEAVRLAREETLEFDAIKEALNLREKKVLQEVREWLFDYHQSSIPEFDSFVLDFDERFLKVKE